MSPPEATVMSSAWNVSSKPGVAIRSLHTFWIDALPSASGAPGGMIAPSGAYSCATAAALPSLIKRSHCSLVLRIAFSCELSVEAPASSCSGFSTHPERDGQCSYEQLLGEHFRSPFASD